MTKKWKLCPINCQTKIPRNFLLCQYHWQFVHRENKDAFFQGHIELAGKIIKELEDLFSDKRKIGVQGKFKLEI